MLCQENLIKPVFSLRKTAFIHTFTFQPCYLVKTKWRNLYRPPPNLNIIKEVCDSLGKRFITLFVENHWATVWLLWTQTLVKGVFLCLITQGCNECSGSLCLQFYYTRLDNTTLYKNTMVKCQSAELSDSRVLARQKMGTARNCILFKIGHFSDFLV